MTLTYISYTSYFVSILLGEVHSCAALIAASLKSLVNYETKCQLSFAAHTTQFTEIGWKYLKHGRGVGHFVFGGSYVSLVSPDGKDLTIVMETMVRISIIQ